VINLVNMDNELSIQYYYCIKNQRFNVLCDSWRYHDDGWCDDFGLFYAIDLWQTNCCTNQYLQSFDLLKPRLPHVRYNRRNKQSFSWKHCVNEQLLLVSVHFEKCFDQNSGLLFTFGLVRRDPYLVPCNNVVDQIWPTSVEFLKHFFAPFA